MKIFLFFLISFFIVCGAVNHHGKSGLLSLSSLVTVNPYNTAQCQPDQRHKLLCFWSLLSSLFPIVEDFNSIMRTQIYVCMCIHEYIYIGRGYGLTPLVYIAYNKILSYNILIRWFKRSIFQ